MLLCEKRFTIYRSIVYDLGDLHHFSIHCRFSAFAYTRQCFGNDPLVFFINKRNHTSALYREGSILFKQASGFFLHPICSRVDELWRIN